MACTKGMGFSFSPEDYSSVGDGTMHIPDTALQREFYLLFDVAQRTLLTTFRTVPSLMRRRFTPRWGAVRQRPV